MFGAKFAPKLTLEINFTVSPKNRLNETCTAECELHHLVLSTDFAEVITLKLCESVFMLKKKQQQQKITRETECEIDRKIYERRNI